MAYSATQVAEALKAAKGLVYLAAQRLGCDPKTITNWKNRSALVKETLDTERGKFLDFAELKLFEAVRKGEPWAIAMVLKTLGRGRGYGDAVDVHLSPRVVYLPAKAPTIHEWEAAHGNGKYSHEAR